LDTKLIEKSHTSIEIKNLIQETLSDFGLKGATIFGIHDNAANMNRASIISGLIDVRCFDHTWDLALKKSFQLMTFKEILNKGKLIVGHFHRSSTAIHELSEAQDLFENKKLKLIQCVDTRWGSNYSMLKRLYENKLCLQNISDKIKLSSELQFTPKEWEIISKILPLLNLITSVYSLLSGEKYATLSLVYPTVMRFISFHLLDNGSDITEISEFKSAFKQEIRIRFSPYDKDISKSPAILSSVLDPRFKKLSFIDESIKKLAFKEIKFQMKP
jgi:hypothetical protein